jgi:hypothetical protein
MNNFNEFLNHSLSQKEISLVIAQNNQDFQKITKNLKKVNYQQCNDIFKLLKLISQPSKIFIPIKDKISKDIYDFVAQYPTSQIEIYNKTKLKSQVSTPIYQNVSIIVLIKKDFLKKTKFPLLEKVGITYQNLK